MDLTSRANNTSANAVGWTIAEYLPLIKIKPTTYHTMPKKLRPRQARIGRRVIIIEPPREYLERLAREQEKEVA